MDDKKVTLSIEVLNEVMAILGQLPFHQVAGVIQKVQADVQGNNTAKPELKAVGEE
jgi:hypothetical protein